MPQPSVRVWATGDGVRVNPETGKYLEDRTDIHADYPSGDYRSRNAVWDAAGRSIKLHAARNEFVAFQVVVESDAPVAGIKVALDRLEGPDGGALSGRNVALFKASSGVKPVCRSLSTCRRRLATIRIIPYRRGKWGRLE